MHEAVGHLLARSGEVGVQRGVLHEPLAHELTRVVGQQLQWGGTVDAGAEGAWGTSCTPRASGLRDALPGRNFALALPGVLAARSGEARSGASSQ